MHDNGTVHDLIASYEATVKNGGRATETFRLYAGVADHLEAKGFINPTQKMILVGELRGIAARDGRTCG